MQVMRETLQDSRCKPQKSQKHQILTRNKQEHVMLNHLIQLYIHRCQVKYRYELIELFCSRYLISSRLARQISQISQLDI